MHGSCAFELIINQEQFHNISSALQVPILLQFMVALYRFGRRVLIVWDVASQFGISKSVVHQFIC